MSQWTVSELLEAVRAHGNVMGVALCDEYEKLRLELARMKPREPVEHELKTLPNFFEDVKSGRKTFEIRFNDRDFRVEDVLLLRTWDEQTGFDGGSVRKRITYVLSKPMFDAIKEGYVVLGLAPGEVPRIR